MNTLLLGTKLETLEVGGGRKVEVQPKDRRVSVDLEAATNPPPPQNWESYVSKQGNRMFKATPDENFWECYQGLGEGKGDVLKNSFSMKLNKQGRNWVLWSFNADMDPSMFKDAQYSRAENNLDSSLESDTNRMYVPYLTSSRSREAAQGSSRNAEAAEISRRVLESGQNDQDGPPTPAQRRDTRRSQGEALRLWAEAEGLMLDNDEFQRRYEEQGAEEGPSGGENDNYRDPGSRRFFKRNTLHLHQMDGWFASFFERMLIHNELFPEAPYRFEGFVDTEQGLLPVHSQPDIDAVRGATRKEVKAYMEARGFEWIGSENYRKGDLFVGDLHEGNALITPSGYLAIIDPEIKRISQGDDARL